MKKYGTLTTFFYIRLHHLDVATANAAKVAWCTPTCTGNFERFATVCSINFSTFTLICKTAAGESKALEFSLALPYNLVTS